MAESQIAELQSVFGTILTLSKRVKPTRQEISTYPHWTGSFRLFDFPREIRDCVYEWYLHEPDSLKYTRKQSQNRVFPFSDSKHVVLFLTCQQVYHEALQVFCRFTYIQIIASWKLEGTLRLFPDKPARMIQRIELIYYYQRYGAHWVSRGRPRAAWAQMITEARVAKSYFPMLRECKAKWYCYLDNLVSEEGLKLHSQQPDEVIMAILLDWMRSCYTRERLIPPKCLKVEFPRSYGYRDIQEPFDRALSTFRNEVKGDEFHQDDIEGSGRQWLEEMSEERHRKKSRKAKRGLK